MIYSDTTQRPKRPATGLTKQILTQPANYVQNLQEVSPSQNLVNLASMARQNAPVIQPSLSSIDVVGGIPFSDRRTSPPTLKPIKSKTNLYDNKPYTPVEQNRFNSWADWKSRNLPTGVENVTREVINGQPSYSNIKPQLDNNGNLVQNNNNLGTIPSLRQNSPSLREILQAASSAQMPAYNAGTQATAIEDSTRGGYYQRRRADNTNKKTMQRLNNQGKERFAIDRQAALDNDQLQTNSLSKRLLGSNVAATERIGDLERTIADFNAPDQQRMAAIQTRNLLNQAAQKAQNNVVTKLSEEMPDGTKRERAVTIDPSTGQQISDIDWNGVDINQYITEYANRTGRTKEDVLKLLGQK